MDRINWSELGGFPLRQNRLKYAQDGILAAFENMGKAPDVLVKYAADKSPVFTKNYVLWGCEVTDNEDDTASVTAGAVFLNGVVYSVDAHTAAITSADQTLFYFMHEITNDPAGIKEYFDGLSHPTQKVYRAKLAYTTVADEEDWLSGAAELEVIQDFVYVPRGAENAFVIKTWMDSFIRDIVEVPLVNDWDTTHSGSVWVHRDVNDVVTVCGHLEPVSGSPSSGVIGTIPSPALRPNAAVRSFVRFNSGTGENVYAKVATTGVISIEFEDGDDAAGDVPTNFLVQYKL